VTHTRDVASDSGGPAVTRPTTFDPWRPSTVIDAPVVCESHYGYEATWVKGSFLTRSVEKQSFVKRWFDFAVTATMEIGCPDRSVGCHDPWRQVVAFAFDFSTEAPWLDCLAGWSPTKHNLIARCVGGLTVPSAVYAGG
jgi:hypothetical protein